MWTNRDLNDYRVRSVQGDEESAEKVMKNYPSKICKKPF